MTDDIDSVTRRFADDLRQGSFAQGAWLKQIDLQARYGVGRPTIRKALDILASRRLIRYERNRGYSVHPKDSRETAQILEIRVAIETGFAPAIITGATRADIAALAGLAERFATLLRDEIFADLYDCNLAFHGRLLSCAGNPIMVTLVEELRLRTSPAPTSQWQSLQRIEISATEHFGMVRAIEDRNAAALATLQRLHIRQPDDRSKTGDDVGRGVAL